MLRSALVEIGASPSPDNLRLAEAFAHLGLALTKSALTEAHTSLAHAPGASETSYALAKSLELPTTPDILRALSTVTGGIPARRALPPEITEWLTLALDAGMEPESLAAHLHQMLSQRGRSVENRLLAAGNQEPAFQDVRTLLLRLAHSAGDRQTRQGADTLAAHIEGQQLINLAAQQGHSPADQIPLYFAVPLQFPAEQTMLEVRLSCRDEEDLPEDGEDQTYLKATLRVATTRLGRVEAQLAGTLSGDLTCRFGAEEAATVRLIQRHTSKLAAALSATGWPSCQVHCQPKTDWTPLWHGGEALTAPRARVDQRA